jgi:hypothetical protein
LDHDAGVVDHSEDDRAFDKARWEGEAGRFDKNFADEPKSGEDAIYNQDLAGIEVSANLGVAPALDNEGVVVKSEDGEQREVESEICEQRSVERGDGKQARASRSDEEIGRADVGAPGPIPDRARGKPNGDPTLASGSLAAKNGRRKSESRRRRREEERIERMRMEQRIEEKLRSGKVTSASKLIEEVLWPSS